MEQEPSRSDLELLRYANAVRTRSRRDVGIATVAAVFITFSIIDAVGSTPARAFHAVKDWPSRAIRMVVPCRIDLTTAIGPFHRGQARNATSPPSIGSTTPVIQRDSSEAR